MKNRIRSYRSSLFAAATVSLLIALGQTVAPAHAGGSIETYKSYKPATDYPYAFDWSGFYLGVFGGYSWGDIKQFPEDGNGKRNDKDVWTGGLLGGYRIQRPSRFVFGAEVSIPLIDDKGTGEDLTFFALPAFNPPVRYEMEVNKGILIAGQVGYAFGRTMPYLELGIGILDATWRTRNVQGLVYTPGAVQEASNTHTIYKVGVGVEHAVKDRVIAGLRYNYMETDKENYETIWNAPPPNPKKLWGHGVFATLTFKLQGRDRLK